MKKTYITPRVYTVTVATQGHLLQDSYHISNEKSGTDAWTKDEGDWDEVWDE